MKLEKEKNLRWSLEELHLTINGRVGKIYLQSRERKNSPKHKRKATECFIMEAKERVFQEEERGPSVEHS